jgi:hypothetical protein
MLQCADYCPEAAWGVAKTILFGATVAASAGLVKLSMADQGVAGSIQRLWIAPKAE